MCGKSPAIHALNPPAFPPTCSAARPPSAMQIMSFICSVVISTFSLGRYCANPSAAEPRGTMETCAGAAAWLEFGWGLWYGVAWCCVCRVPVVVNWGGGKGRHGGL